MIDKTEALVNGLCTKKNSDPDDFCDKFYEAFKEIIILNSV
jgi:hypothetical protein